MHLTAEDMPAAEGQRGGGEAVQVGNPHITRTSGEYLAHNGIHTFACAGAPRLGFRLRFRHPPRCPMALACCSRLGVTWQWSRALHGSDHVLCMLRCIPSLHRCRRADVIGIRSGETCCAIHHLFLCLPHSLTADGGMRLSMALQSRRRLGT